MKKVCVFGSYKNLSRKEKRNTVKLGRLLAEKGFVVMTGGFGGTMEDVSRGAKEAGGKTIGVTYYKWRGKAHKKPNKYVDEEIKTENIFRRIEIMAKNADAFIVLPGGTGTLLELAACLELVNKGLMRPKYIIAIGDFWKSAVQKLIREPVLSAKARSALKAGSCRELIMFVATPEQAVKELLRL